MSRAAIIPDAKLVAIASTVYFLELFDTTVRESLAKRSVHEKLGYCGCIVLS